MGHPWSPASQGGILALTPGPPKHNPPSAAWAGRPAGPADPYPLRLQENETWWLCNCTMAVCKHNNTVELVEVECNPPPMPTCSNNLTPVRVMDPDGCCWHWECDCKPTDATGTLPTISLLWVGGFRA